MLAYFHGDSMISIIIPILNEAPLVKAESFRHWIESLMDSDSEVIFVDGGSNDGTRELLSNEGYTVIDSAPGRALQMNTGAKCANGNVLLFLHGDSRIEATLLELRNEISDAPWGFFSLLLERESLLYRLIAKGIRFRARVFSVATGDQGIFINAAVFKSMGGYKDMALMEDVEISRRLKKIAPPRISKHKIIASARRWESAGPIKTVVFMWCLQLAYKCGVSPTAIHRWYYGPTQNKN